MGIEIIIIFVLFMFLLLVGTPVAFALALPSLFYFFFMQDGHTPLVFIPHAMTMSLTSFILIAVPAFILSGRMMNSAGVTDRIFKLAIGFVGRFRGGLAYANVLASMMFTAMSGTAVGDAGGLGPIQMKMMTKAGYRPAYSAALSASSSVLGPIFPPSVVMVVLAATVELSVGRLFLGGVIPGLIMGVALLINVFIKSRFSEEGRSWPVEAVSLREVRGSIAKAILPIFTPLIILGGIMFGIFTPTEAAIVAVAYATLLGIIFGELNLKRFIETMVDTVITCGVLLFLIGTAGFFTWVITVMGLPRILADFLVPLAEIGPGMTMFVMAVVFLVIGMFLDTTAAILMTAPILFPIASAAGIDSVHFGVVMIVALVTGIITPPFGICVFVMSDVAKLPVKVVQKEAIRYLPVMLIVLAIISLFPGVVLWLPNLLMG